MQDNSQKMTKMKQLLTECENSVNCLKTTKILVSANYCYFSDGCCELLYFLHAVLSKGEKYQVPINMGEEDTLTQIQFVDHLRTRCSNLRDDTLLFKLACCMLMFIGEYPVK